MMNFGSCPRCQHAYALHSPTEKLSAAGKVPWSCESCSACRSNEAQLAEMNAPEPPDVSRFVQIAAYEGLHALDAAGDVWVYRYHVPGFEGDGGYRRADMPAHWERLASARGLPGCAK